MVVVGAAAAAGRIKVDIANCIMMLHAAVVVIINDDIVVVGNVGSACWGVVDDGSRHGGGV